MQYKSAPIPIQRGGMEQKEEHAKRVVRLWFMAIPHRKVLV
jgi:hypothetical protein